MKRITNLHTWAISILHVTLLGSLVMATPLLAAPQTKITRC
jgi:hypothetical protein